MIRYGMCWIWIIGMALLLNGCWNYEGLDTLDIVTGMSVDKDEDTGNYRLLFEIVDTNSGDENEMKAKYVEAEGKTIFDAVRNSKRRLINKLYGGNMQTLIISRRIAETEGVYGILEELLRDGEPRETMSIVISAEDTAREILLTEGIDSHFIAYEVHDMIREDSSVTAATTSMPLYQAYNAIKGPGNALVLPSIHVIRNNGTAVAEVDGIALFKGDRLIGFLSGQNTKWFLFLKNEIKGGVVSFPVSKPDESISMEIKYSQSKTKVDYLDGQVKIKLDVKAEFNIMEIKSHLDIAQSKQREALETLTERFLEERIKYYFRTMQDQYKTDIFSFGRWIYRKNPAVWRSIEPNWNELFKHAQLEVRAEVDVVSSGVLKSY